MTSSFRVSLAKELTDTWLQQSRGAVSKTTYTPTDAAMQFSALDDTLSSDVTANQAGLEKFATICHGRKLVEEG